MNILIYHTTNSQNIEEKSIINWKIQIWLSESLKNLIIYSVSYHSTHIIMQ